MPSTLPTEQLSAYLDGELNDVERAEVEDALSRDPSLRAELQTIEEASAFLRTHGPVSAPDGFQQRVLDAVKDEPMPGAWWRWLRRPFGLPIEGIAVAAAAALVLIVALPAGLMTGVDAGSKLQELASSERTSSAPASYDEDDAVADLGEVEPSEDMGGEGEAPGKEAAAPDQWAPDEPPPVTKGAPRPAPSPRAMPTPQAKTPPPPPPSADPVADGDAEPTADDLAEPTTAADPKADAGTADDDTPTTGSPAMVGSYRYDILTTDPDALLRLQRIAARYRGVVTDDRGSSVQGGDLKSTETYLVHLPAEALAEFGDALRDLGQVSETREDRMVASEQVKVQVTMSLAPSKSRTRPMEKSDDMIEPAQEQAQ